MKLHYKPLCLALLVGVMVFLCSCGASSSQKLNQIPIHFSAQNSVNCTIQYTAHFDAVIDGVEYSDLEHSCMADAQADLNSGSCWVLGEMTAALDQDSSQATEIEVYEDDTGSYYRYGDFYGYDSPQNTFLSLIRLPGSLDLTQEFTAQEATEILYGTECTVYTGTEIADDSPQSLLLGPTEGATFSLDGCLVDVALYVYNSTGLPACIKLDYSNLGEMDLSFSDAAGNLFTITSLSYQVLYPQYGAQVSVTVPDAFRQAALNGDLSFADSFGSLTEPGQTDSQDTAPEQSTEFPKGETSDSYQIANSAKTYSYEISTPTNMALDSQSDDSVSFYYYYGETDYEIISYSICEGLSHQDEENFALSLPDLYRQGDGISQVSSDGLHSITIGDYQVWYTVIDLTAVHSGQVYQVLDLYSWVETPNGQDCLEVCITEYNSSQAGVMIDPEDELEYAYDAIQDYKETQ